jgi:hypothetical protein
MEDSVRVENMFDDGLREQHNDVVELPIFLLSKSTCSSPAVSESAAALASLQQQLRLQHILSIIHAIRQECPLGSDPSNLNSFEEN